MFFLCLQRETFSPTNYETLLCLFSVCGETAWSLIKIDCVHKMVSVYTCDHLRKNMSRASVGEFSVEKVQMEKHLKMQN